MKPDLEAIRALLHALRNVRDREFSTPNQAHVAKNETRMVLVENLEPLLDYAEALEKQLAEAQSDAADAKELATKHYREAEAAYARGLEHGHAAARAKALREAATYVELNWELDRPDHGVSTPAGDRARRVATRLRALATSPAEPVMTLGCQHGRLPGHPCPHCAGRR